ncbi:MAG: PKD domain-containing protein [Solirubrobacteraceae bacterium]
MRFARWALPALVAVSLAVVGAGATPAASQQRGPSRDAKTTSGVDAHVLGSFSMAAFVTVAVNVRGEHAGERLMRTWTIVPRGCRRSACEWLDVDRELSAGRHLRITLKRVGIGRYSGRGAFYVALACLGRIYPRGSRVPYRVTLTVRSATMVNTLRFARRITARYVNPERSDATPCPLGPSHDAAVYSGSALSAVPSPPHAAFDASEVATSDTFSFEDSSTPGVGGAPIVGRLWSFGDPASGPRNASTARDPSHTFSAPGSHVVTLRVTDTNGLRTVAARQVLAPPPPAPPPPAPPS